MKSIAASALAFLFVPMAFAANPARDLLSNYSPKDANEKCEVTYKDDVVSIESLYQSRASYQRYVSGIEQLNPDVIRLSHTDRDGSAEVYLIRKAYSLVVMATWEDGENGLDASSFCELGLLEKAGGTSGPQIDPPHRTNREETR